MCEYQRERERERERSEQRNTIEAHLTKFTSIDPVRLASAGASIVSNEHNPSLRRQIRQNRSIPLPVSLHFSSSSSRPSVYACFIWCAITRNNFVCVWIWADTANEGLTGGATHVPIMFTPRSENWPTHCVGALTRPTRYSSHCLP